MTTRASHQHITTSSRHLTASMVVIDQTTASVLLVHHNATGKFLFPGGHVDPDETPGEAALREVFEETGVRASIVGQPVDLLGMIWHPSPFLTAEIPAPAKPERPGKPAEPAHTHIDLLFIGTADSSDPLTALLDEVASVRWVPIADLDLVDVRAEVPGVAEVALQHLLTCWTYDPVNPQHCSYRDDPGHDHNQCLEQHAAEAGDAHRSTPYQLEEAAQVADRIGRKLDAQWFRARAQAQRDGRPEPEGPTPQQRVDELHSAQAAEAGDPR